MEEAEKGLVFDMHRGTLHDGPGMRTTIFMKGCPLRCEWCHNPESIGIDQEIQWTLKKCIGCLRCKDACEVGAIEANEGCIKVESDKCSKCYKCTDRCPSGALEKVGRYWGVAELAKESCKDEMFFEDFNGGITISGGEPMMQYKFTTELSKQLKKMGKNIALDTCGFASRKAYEAIYPYIDVFLFDIKVMDREKHLLYTGVSNEIILENLLWIAKKISQDVHKKLWIRTPLIPQATATISNLQEIGAFLKENILSDIERWELCAFNNICKDKYTKMNLEWKYSETSLISDSQVKAFSSVGKQYVGEKLIVSGLTAKV